MCRVHHAVAAQFLVQCHAADPQLGRRAKAIVVVPLEDVVNELDFRQLVRMPRCSHRWTLVLQWA